MATIRELKPSISQMSFEEAEALVKKLRESRRTYKEKLKPKPIKLAKPKTSKTPKKLIPRSQLIASTSDADKLKLIAELEALLK